MELNCAVPVTQWPNIMLNFKYIVNPDGAGAVS